MLNRLFLSFLFLFFSFLSFAQEVLETQLFKAGFEGVMIQESDSGDSLLIFYEHRSLRNAQESMQLIRKILGEAVSGKHLSFVPLYQSRPLYLYPEGGVNVRSLDSGEIGFLNQGQSFSSQYRFDFRLRPDFSARLGKFDDPFQHKTNLILDSRIYLLPGLSLLSGILLPLHNGIDTQEMNVRLAPSHLQFFNQFLPGHFVQASLGFFHGDRYGFDLQYRYFPSEKDWSIGIESNWTGFYFFPSSGLFTNALDTYSLVLDVEYRIPFIPYLSFRWGGGRYLAGDMGIRFDVIRQFGHIDFGVYMAASQNGTNAGFSLTFPIFPGNIFRTDQVQLRSTEAFRWEYGYNNEASVARRFSMPSPRLSDVLRQYHPRFIQFLYE